MVPVYLVVLVVSEGKFPPTPTPIASTKSSEAWACTGAGALKKRFLVGDSAVSRGGTSWGMRAIATAPTANRKRGKRKGRRGLLDITFLVYQV
jgi:hypothetical protein